MTALIEVDVTEPRKFMADYRKQTGERLSFTAFIINCLGEAIGSNRIIHARRDFWGSLYLFRDIDCAVMIEISYQGQKFPLVHVLKDINRRTYRSIHEEVRAVQKNPNESVNHQRNVNLIGLFLRMPWFIRDIFYWTASKSPRFLKRQAGTVVVSSVGMFGNGGGWGLGPGSIYTTAMTVGGIARKPGVVDERIEIREYLNLTVDIDHDIIDGAPAARFLSQLHDLIESSYGLDEVHPSTQEPIFQQPDEEAA